MSTSTHPPAWYPDPANPVGSERWWDGAQWTDHTRPVPDPSSPSGTPHPAIWNQAPGGPGGPGSMLPTGWTPRRTPSAQGSAFQRNHDSIVAIALAVAYVAFALVTNFALLGIAPLLVSLRARSRREPLSSVAIAVAVVAMVVAVLKLTHHHTV